MTQIKINSTDAKLKSANTRPEMHGDDTKIGMDLKFECATDGALLKTLINCDEVPPFWHEDGTIKYVGFGLIPLRADLRDCTVEFGDLAHHKIVIEGAKVNSLKFQPIAGRAMKLELRVQYNPTDEELVRWNHAVLKTMELHIAAELGIDPEDADDDSQADLLDGEE